jgi:hypothetical protein
VTEDDAEARRRRALELRREIEELREGGRAAQPPRSPYEFIEREMREPADDEPEEGAEQQQRADVERESNKPDEPDEPPSG